MMIEAPWPIADARLQRAYEHFCAGELDQARAQLNAQTDAGAQQLLELIEFEQIAHARGDSGAPQTHATPASAAVCERYGRLRFEQRNFVAARHWLRAALGADRSRSSAYYWLGNALRMLGDTAGAEVALQEAIRRAPEDSQGYVALAFLYRASNRFAEAADTALRIVAAFPSESRLAEKVLGFLEDLHRHDLAERVAATLQPRRANDSAFLIRLGRLREKTGQFEGAAECYRRALGLDPTAAAAGLGLAVVRRFERLDDPDVRAIQSALEATDSTTESRTCAHFALGKIHDDLGDYERAFDHYRQANSLRARAQPFDSVDFRKHLTDIRAIFTRTGFADLARARVTGAITPILVVGMLRSGTTLVESMLGAHPDICPAGELHDIGAIAASLGGGPDPVSQYPACIRSVACSTLDAAASRYLTTLAALAGGRRCVIDKNPTNFLDLGLVALLTPSARVVHCIRHPLDVCLSIYFQHFAHAANAYAYDLETIADFYIEYDRLMRHWREHLPLAVHDVEYERLVRDPGRTISEVLDFLGVPFDEKCLQFDTVSRTITTASTWQARQPLYADSIGRWRNYARHLGTLVDRLRAAGIAIDH